MADIRVSFITFFLGLLSSLVRCSVSRDWFSFALCPSRIHENKVKRIQATFNTSVDNLHCRLHRGPRQTRDWRFWVRPARIGTWKDNCSRTKFFSLTAICDERMILCDWLCKSNFADTCGRANPTFKRYVWTGERDVQTLRVNADVSEKGKKACVFKFIRKGVDRPWVRGRWRNISQKTHNNSTPPSWQSISLSASYLIIQER